MNTLRWPVEGEALLDTTLPPRPAVPRRVGPPPGRASDAPEPGAASVLRRARPDIFGPVSSLLRWSVIVPARNEEEALPRLVAALDAQAFPASGEAADARPPRPASPSPFATGEAEAIVLLNNCTDRSEAVLAGLAASRPWLRWRHVRLAAPEAHVGRARQIAMDAACARLLRAGNRGGAILSTDADTAPAPDWIAQTAAEVSRGADAVGGRAMLPAGERASLAPGVRRFYLLDLAYRRALEELRGLYAPEPHDPLPRHHHHFGASLAVTAEAYARAGGLPAIRTSEDAALVDALLGTGARLRHSPAVRVRTSARATGRASGGLADAFAWWAGEDAAGREPMVEPAAAAERRLAALGVFAAARPECPPPHALRATPEPTPEAQETITGCIAGLRRRIAALRALTPSDRLLRARRLARRPVPALL